MSATTSITMQPVTSSQFAAYGHSQELNLLAIQFHPKKSTGVSDTYHYQGVDVTMFAEFVAAESQGSFFIQRIKKFPEQFPYQKLDAAALLVSVDPVTEKLAADHAEALAFHERFYVRQMTDGVHYSGSKFKENGDPVMLNADGSRNIFCDVDE